MDQTPDKATGTMAVAQQWKYFTLIPATCWDIPKQKWVLDDKDFDHIHEILNYVGQLGWELVSVTDRPNSNVMGGRSNAQLAYYFKRPLLGAPS